MPDKIRPSLFRKQKDPEPLSGADLYRGSTGEVPIHARYGADTADHAANRLNALRSSDTGPFMGHPDAMTSSAPPPAPHTRRTTIIEESGPNPADNSSGVLFDKYDQKKKLGY